MHISQLKKVQTPEAVGPSRLTDVYSNLHATDPEYFKLIPLPFLDTFYKEGFLSV